MANQSNLSGLSPKSIATKAMLFFTALLMSSVLASSMSPTFHIDGLNSLEVGTPWEKVITLDTTTMDSSGKDKNVYTSLLHIAEGIPHIDPLEDITASIVVKLDFNDATAQDTCNLYACYTRFAPVNIPEDPLLFNENCFSFFFADSKATSEKPMTKNFPLPTDQGYFSFYLRTPPKRKADDVISCSATVKLSGRACKEDKIGNECSTTPLLLNADEPMDITYTKDSFETLISLAPVSSSSYMHSVQLNGITNKPIKVITGDGFVPTLTKYTTMHDPSVVTTFTILIRSLRFTTTPAPSAKLHDDLNDDSVAKLQGGLFKTYIRIISDPNDLAFITGFVAQPLLCEKPTAGPGCMATLVTTDMSSALAFNRTNTASSLLGTIRSLDKHVNTTHINIGFSNVPYAQAITTELIPQLKPYTIPPTLQPLISPRANSHNPSLYLRMGAVPVLNTGTKPIFDVLITSYAKDDLSRFYALPPLAKFADHDLQWYYILVWDSLVTSENNRKAQEELLAQNIPAVGLWFDTQCPRSCSAPHGICPAETSFPVPPQDLHRCICAKGMMGWDCRTEESSPTPKPKPFWKQEWFLPVCIAAVVTFTLFLCICCVKSCKKKSPSDNIFPNAYERLDDSERVGGIDERQVDTAGQKEKARKYGYQEGDSRSFTGGYLDSRNPVGRRKANPVYDVSGTASGYGGLYAITGTASGLGSGSMNATSNSGASTNLTRTPTGHDMSANLGPSTSIDTRLGFENAQTMKPELTSHGLAVFTQKSGRSTSSRSQANASTSSISGSPARGASVSSTRQLLSPQTGSSSFRLVIDSGTKAQTFADTDSPKNPYMNQFLTGDDNANRYNEFDQYTVGAL